MREIELTRGKVAIVDDEDYERVAQFSWYALKGYKTKWYAVRSVPDARTGKYTKFLYMHRFILEGCDAPRIDHKDGNGLHNFRNNLRPCTPGQNAGNTGLSSANYSGFRGVTWHAKSGKWRARLTASNTGQYLGIFSDLVKAAQAYDAAAAQHFGEFAYLNFPPLPVAAGMLEGLS